jgi:1-acyl-sn-glycerol-3-phosphate acyltransferase
MIQRSLFQRVLYRTLQRVLQLLGILFYRVRYSGQHNIPATGSVLVVSNHQSHLDPLLIGVGSRRMMSFVARITLFRFAPFAWLIRNLGAFPIDRDGVGMAGIKESMKRLKAGELVVIFPEGTRTQDGAIGDFRPGFTALAVRTKATILPVAIEGAFAAWPKSQKYPGLGRIRVHFGRPLTATDFAGMDDRELVAEVERRVRECHTTLLQQAAS